MQPQASVHLQLNLQPGVLRSITSAKTSVNVPPLSMENFRSRFGIFQLRGTFLYARSLFRAMSRLKYPSTTFAIVIHGQGAVTAYEL